MGYFLSFHGLRPLIGLLLVATALSTAAVVSNGTASAAKPQEVVEWSNGFPSGPHFNLNIHGKKDGYICDSSEPGGGSVFVPEYGTSQIQMVQNKKSSVSELIVHDKCGDAFDGDPAVAQLPKGEYQVYARILAKPKKDDEPREVTFFPQLIEACNDATVYDINGDGVTDVNDLLLIDVNGDGVIDAAGAVPSEHDLNGDGVVDQADLDLWLATFGDLIECTDSSLIALGGVTANGAFTVEDQTLERTKGKSKAVDVTDMFTYTGIAFDTSLDLDGDGDLDIDDLLLTDINGDGAVDAIGAVPSEHDINGDGVVDNTDLDLWIGSLILAGLYQELNQAWIFDIADLVVYGWDYQNNGSKLVQVRYYPVDQTEFVQ